MATIYDGPNGKIRNWKGKRELDTYTLEDSFEKLINKPEEDNDDGREYVKFLKEAAGLQQGSNGGAGAGSDEDDDDQDQNTKPSDNEDDDDQNLNDNDEEGNENEEGEEGEEREGNEEDEESPKPKTKTEESFRRLKKNIYGKTKINLSEEEILRAEKALSEALLELEEDEVGSGNVSSDVPSYEGGKEPKDDDNEEGNAVEESFFFDEDDKVKIKVKHPGILEVPEGKEVDELPFSHFAALVKEHGYDEISKALTNLEVWNREREPELADWAKDMRERLKAKFDTGTKAESYSRKTRSRFFLEDDNQSVPGINDDNDNTNDNTNQQTEEESFLFEDMLFEDDNEGLDNVEEPKAEDESFLFEDMLFEDNDEDLGKDELFSTSADELHESFLFEDEDLEDKEEDEEDGAVKRTIDKLEKDRDDEDLDTDEEDEEDGAIKRTIDKMEDNRKSESFWYSSKKKGNFFLEDESLSEEELDEGLLFEDETELDNLKTKAKHRAEKAKRETESFFLESGSEPDTDLDSMLGNNWDEPYNPDTNMNHPLHDQKDITFLIEEPEDEEDETIEDVEPFEEEDETIEDVEPQDDEDNEEEPDVNDVRVSQDISRLRQDLDALAKDQERDMDEEDQELSESFFEEGCENPGQKIRSNGMGRGLGRGNGEGPMGEPFGDDEEEAGLKEESFLFEDEDMENPEGDQDADEEVFSTDSDSDDLEIEKEGSRKRNRTYYEPQDEEDAEALARREGYEYDRIKDESALINKLIVQVSSYLTEQEETDAEKYQNADDNTDTNDETNDETDNENQNNVPNDNGSNNNEENQ